uniref:Uncharacterized protein n=1 Tax=Quercus lobata TaxID=97700 RepID=A0A7N2RCI5_QUELO
MFTSIGELFEFPTETKLKVTYDRPFHGYSSFPPFERMMIDNATSKDVWGSKKKVCSAHTFSAYSIAKGRPG